MKSLRSIAAILTAILVATATAAPAQSPFSAAIRVNDDVITFYEIDQRERMLRAFNTPGDLRALAREQLVEDRLKLQELERVGLRLTDDTLREQMEAFATRANLSYPQFLQVLSQAGVAEETLRDFVRVGVSWRDYVGQRYGDRAEISDREVKRALGTNAGADSGIELLLAEIIIPAPPGREAQARAEAERIARLTSTAAFAAEARRVSALPSAAQGGQLGWTPVDNYPPQIRGILLDLSPGEVTAPIPIRNGVALFQLRDIREVTQAPQPPAAIEYAALTLPGGRGADALAEAARIDARTDTCDDLYGEARGLPPERLRRETLPPAQIPADVALELAKLDPGEASWALTGDDGRTLVFVMLCARLPSLDADEAADELRGRLRAQRLTGYADALLAELRAAATIRTE